MIHDSSDDPIAALVLGLEQLFIRLANEVGGGQGAVAVGGGDADAHSQRKGLVLVLEGMFLDHRSYPLGDDESAVEVRFRQNDDEFLAAVAGKQLFFAHTRLDASGQLAEREIAAEVAQF